MNRLLKYLLLLTVLAVLFFSIGQNMFDFLPKWKLNGSFDPAPDADFSWDAWFDGSYQPPKEKWLNEQIGAREYLIRLRNQYYFSTFHIAKANGVIPCKNGVLVDQGYADAFYGNDFAGHEFLTERLRGWKHVQEGLDSLGVKAFLTLAPGKASFFEEDFPEFLKQEHRPMTNYQFIRDWGSANDLNILDLKRLFHLWNDTSTYPLFPKGGIHWSEYAAAHVCDTLRGYIQSQTNRPLQKFWFDINVSDTARGGDNDIADGMNLIFTPKKERLAYPVRYFGEDSTIVPTKFLVIADSYYYALIYSGFADRVCSYGGFWYYFRQAEPGHMFSSTNVEELNLLEELKKQDVLMLLMTEPQMQRFGWGSVEKLEEVLFPESETSR